VEAASQDSALMLCLRKKATTVAAVQPKTPKTPVLGFNWNQFKQAFKDTYFPGGNKKQTPKPADDEVPQTNTVSAKKKMMHQLNNPR
jgi:hypothetical protein